MNFLQHTNHWIAGEIFEASLGGAFGLVLLVSAALFWFFGTTPNAKALVIPLFVVSLIFVSSGISGVMSNQTRRTAYAKAYQDNPIQFVQSEKERVEGFESLYTFTKILATFCFALALLAFFFVSNRYLQAVAIALVLVGSAGLTIDYFAKERADFYYQSIQKELGQNK